MIKHDISMLLTTLNHNRVFNIRNISYFEIRPTHILHLGIQGYEIKVCDMSDPNPNNWESEVKIFTHEEIKKLIDEEF